MKFKNDIDEKDLPNYKIFWVDSKQIKHTVMKFKAECDEDAHAKLDEYAVGHVDHEYYYGKVLYARCLSSSGKMTIRPICEDSAFSNDEDQSIFMNFLSNVGDFFSFWLWQKPIDWWYRVKDIIYLLKHNEARSNQWNLDMHLLDSIELNLPSLIENSHGLMFLDEAILRLHGNEDGFDLNKYHEKHCSSYPTDVERLAMKIQNEEYNKLLHYVKLYKYCLNAGVIDTDNPDEVDFDKKWRHELPIKPGTYDEFEYGKLSSMCDSLWNNIWDWVKKYGHTLYD